MGHVYVDRRKDCRHIASIDEKKQMQENRSPAEHSKKRSKFNIWYRNFDSDWPGILPYSLPILSGFLILAATTSLTIVGGLAHDVRLGFIHFLRVDNGSLFVRQLVPFSELQRIHAECSGENANNSSKSLSGCMAAADTWCVEKNYVAGIAQLESVDKNAADVTCIISRNR